MTATFDVSPSSLAKRIRVPGGTIMVDPVCRRGADGQETTFWLRRDHARTAQRWSTADAERTGCTLAAFIEQHAVRTEPRGGALNKRQQARAASASRLREAARFLFANVGYFDVGVRDVAARMGSSTGAVFNHVPDKPSLWRFAMNGPAPSQQLTEEVALIQALRPGWSWVLRFNGAEHLASLTPPDWRPNALPPTRAHSGRGACPAEALRQARIDAERHDADRGGRA